MAIAVVNIEEEAEKVSRNRLRSSEIEISVRIAQRRAQIISFELIDNHFININCISIILYRFRSSEGSDIRHKRRKTQVETKARCPLPGLQLWGRRQS